jgi:hypothetical protein
MEIRDYLRAIRRILWLVIAIPVVAALLVGGFIELQPSSYEAQASAVVPAITANGISQSAASQYADTFKDVLASQQVIPVVAQKYNIPQSELVAGLSSNTTTASSNLINVQLIGKRDDGKKPQDLLGAVREATIDTMNAIAEPQLIEATDEVTTAATLLQKAQTAINNFDTEYNNPSPTVQFNDQSSVVNQEKAQLQTAIINNDQARVNILNATILKSTALLGQYGQQLQIFEPLAAELSAANAASAHAASAQVAAQALIATDSAPGTVTAKNVGRLSKLSDVIKFAAIAFALALLMMLGLILILELMRSGKRQDEPDGTQQGAFAWAPPAAQTRAAGPPATPAMAGPATGGAMARDPWRATTTSSTADGDGNGNGNGHDTGGATADAPDADAEPQRAGLFRRR